MLNSIKLFIVGMIASITALLTGHHLPAPTPIAIVASTATPAPVASSIPTSTPKPVNKVLGTNTQVTVTPKATIAPTPTPQIITNTVTIYAPTSQPVATQAPQQQYIPPAPIVVDCSPVSNGIANLKSEEQSEITSETNATNSIMIARGLSLDDPAVQQNLATALAPIYNKYNGEINNFCIQVKSSLPSCPCP